MYISVDHILLGNVFEVNIILNERFVKMMTGEDKVYLYYIAL